MSEKQASMQVNMPTITVSQPQEIKLQPVVSVTDLGRILARLRFEVARKHSKGMVTLESRDAIFGALALAAIECGAERTYLDAQVALGWPESGGL